MTRASFQISDIRIHAHDLSNNSEIRPAVLPDNNIRIAIVERLQPDLRLSFPNQSKRYLSIHPYHAGAAIITFYFWIDSNNIPWKEARGHTVALDSQTKSVRPSLAIRINRIVLVEDADRT